jgi:peptidoglycan/xylan/chitin deacetylase (PgdA/CDA1 family)
MIYKRIRPVWSLFLVLLFFLTATSHSRAEESHGAMVLTFDDGYPGWIKTVAPELERVGGLATCFVNNQRIHNRDISFEDLRILQNKYGWEIGTHTYHHFNAVEFVRNKGLSLWIRDELEASVNELKSQGLTIRSLVFPFNTFNSELSNEVSKKFESFRYSDPFPITDHKKNDGSIPGKSIDIMNYVPIEQIIEWIDFAYKNKRLLFLYGHEVLPDEEFAEGQVASVERNTLFANKTVDILAKKELCLVPDKSKRNAGNPIKVLDISEKEIRLQKDDLLKLTKPGATFIVGPCYATQFSYFKTLIEYAAKKLPFLTVHAAVNDRFKIEK